MIRTKVMRVVLLLVFLWKAISLSAQESCGNAVPVPSLTGSPCATATPGTVDNLGPGSCDEGTLDTWFSFTAQGGSATVTVTSTISNWKPEFLIVSSSNNGCTGAFTEVNCTDGANAPYATINSTTTGLIPGNTYWIVVSSGAPNLTTGTLSVCVNNPLVVQNCVDNDACLDAATITLNAPGGAATCLTDCNNGANPGIDFTGNNCADSPNATVWYEFTTSANTATIDVTLTSSQLSDPEFTIFEGNTCTTFAVEDCVEGTAGSASSLGLLVQANTTYLIAVSDVTGDQGTFTLCITQNADNSSCNTNSALTVVSTSMGSPLTGPFQPGEVVTYQYTITDFTQFNCNYIGAVVPTFGSCWSPSSFNAQGMPLYVSTPLNVNGVIQPCGPGPPCAWAACAGTPAGSWNWFPAGAATYNINGYYPAGTPMPAGWYFLSSYNPATGACTGDPTDPDNTYGDGSFPNCGTNTFDYTLVFSLIAGPSTNCTSGATDCGVTIKTFADGEFGTWNNIGCSGDLPATYPASFACCTPPTITPLTNPTICSNTSPNITLTSNQDPTVTYSWTVVSGANISGAAAGTGTTINQTLVNSGTVAQTAVYTITANNGTCSSVTTLTITVQPRPTITNSPTTSSICSNTLASITPTANVTGTTFTWTAAPSGPTITGSSTPGTGSISQTLSNSGTTSGTVTYTVTPTGPAPSSCPGTPVNFVVTVNPRPTITNSPTASQICSGTAATITPTANVASTTFTWTASASAGTITGFSATGSGAINQTLTNTGTTSGTVTYVVTPTGPAPSNCPGTPVNFDVTVNPRPTITNAPTASTICSGNAASITPTANVTGTTFTWTASSSIPAITGFTATGSGNISQTLTNSGATSGTVTYAVTPIGPAPSNCPGNPVNFVVTVNPVPTITNSPTSASICSGTAATIAPTSNVTGTTYTWTASASSASITGFTASGSGNINQTLTNTGTIAGTVTYVVTPIGPAPSSCPGTPVNFVVTVNPRPTITNNPTSSSICSGTNAVITPTTDVLGTTFTWTASASSGSISGFSATGSGNINQNITNLGTTSGSVTYAVTPIGPAPSNCPGNPVNFVVTVNPVPTITNNPTTASICSGTAASIAPTSNVTGTTYTWTASASSASITGFTASGSGNINQTLTNTGTIAGTVTYVVTPIGPATTNCPGTPVNFVVTVNPRPVITNNPTASAICSGALASITPTADVLGSTFTWTASASAATLSGFSTNGSGAINQTLSNSASVSGTVTYAVTPIGPAPSSCPGLPVDFVVTVNPIPQVTNAVTAQSICSGSVASIAPTSNVSSSTFTWTASSSSGSISGFSASGSGNISQTLINAGTTAGSVTYIVTPIGPAPTSCPGTPVNFVVTVNPRPTITNSPTTSSICSGSLASITPSSNILGTSYSWTATNSLGSITGFTASGTGNISQTLTNNSTTTGTVTYTVTPTGPAPSSCPGLPVDFVVTVLPKPVISVVPQDPSICNAADGFIQVTLSSGSSSNGALSWNGTSSSSISPINISSVSNDITGLTAGSYNVSFTDASGCVSNPVNVALNNPNAPVINPINDTLSCGIPYTLNLSSVTGTNLTAGLSFWSSAGGPSGGGTQFANGTILSTGNTTVYVYDNNGSCSSQIQFVVSVSSIPTITNSNTPQNICSGSSATITLTSSLANTTFNWTAISSGASVSGFSSSGSGNINQVLTNTNTSAGSITYTVIPIGPSPSFCEGTPVNFVVNVNPIPQIQNSTTFLDICSGTSNGILPNSSVAGSSFVWTASASSLNLSGFSTNGTGGISQTITNSGQTTESVTYTVTPSGPSPTFCVGSPFDFVINVSPRPILTNSPLSSAICSGSSFNLVPTANLSGTSFNWTASASAASVSGYSTSGLGSISQALVNSSATVETVTYQITPTGPLPTSCLGLPVNYIVSLQPAPIITNNPTTAEICSGTSANIVPTASIVGSTFSWTAATPSPAISGFISSGTGSINQTLTNASVLPGVITYTITPTGPAPTLCLGSSVNFEVTVQPIPVVTNVNTNQTICSGLSALIVPISNTAGTTFTWTASASSAALSGYTANGNGNIDELLNNSGVTSEIVTYVITPMGPSPSSCPGVPVNFEVTVNPTPQITNANTSFSICSGSTLSIIPTSNVSGAGFTWTSSVAGGNISGVSPSGNGNIDQNILNSGVASESVTYTVTPVVPSPSVCPGSSQDFIVTIDPIPTISSVVYDDNICSGATFNLTPASNVLGTSFLWSASSPVSFVSGYSANGTGAVSEVINNTGITSGIVNYQVIPIGPSPNSCNGLPTNYSLVVHPVPQLTNVSTSDIFCSGSQVTFNPISNISGTTYSWTASASSSNLVGLTTLGSGSINQTLSNSGTATESAIYTIVPNGPAPEFCSGNPFVYTVNVEPTPIVNPSAINTSICSGSLANITLTSTVAGTSFEWLANSISPNVSGFTASGNGNILQTLNNVGTSVGSVNYVVTPVGPAPSSCPGLPVTLTVNVEPIPSVTNSTTQFTECSGVLVAINLQAAVSGTTFNWVSNPSSANVTGNSSSGSGNITQTLTNGGSTQENVTYVVTPSGPTPGFCVGLPVNFVINVDPIPVITNVVTTASICSGNSVTFDPTSNVSGTTFDWMSLPSTASISGYSITGTGSITNTLINSGSTSGTVTYTITPTSPAPSSCEGTPLPFVVTVFSNPTAAISPDPLALCLGETVSLNGGAQGGSATYSQHAWSGNGAVYLNNTTLAQPVLTGSLGGNFDLTYTVTDNNGCVGSDQLSVAVFTNPLIDQISPVTACGSYTLPQITGTDLNSPAYWDGSMQTGNQVQTGTAITTSTTLFMYDGASNCYDEDTLQITINPLPELLFLSEGDTYCEGEPISPILVEVSGSADWTIEFTIDGVNQTVTSSQSPIELGTSPGLYTLSMLTDNFCSNGLDASATVIVNPLPPAPFTGGDTTYCSNWEPIPLTASGSGGNLTWYADETLTTPISTIPSMEVGATTYYVSETLNGCQGSPSSVTITIENCNITVPTAFTPDGDNVNDSWEIIDLDYVYPENVVYVYNRWGGLIYQSDKGAYSIEPWKGDYKGNSLPVGSYYYVIELNDGKTDPLKGIISIIMND